jgi:hypothetical protein
MGPPVQSQINSARERRKPGPKRDRDTAWRVDETVKGLAPGGDWKAALSAICEALDESPIPCPKTWRRRTPPITDWADAAVTEPELAKKAISHHLKNAKN